MSTLVEVRKPAAQEAIPESKVEPMTWFLDNLDRLCLALPDGKAVVLMTGAGHVYNRIGDDPGQAPIKGIVTKIRIEVIEVQTAQI